MNTVSFLDCTLRDGGYINDWRFGNFTIRAVVSRLDAAGLDYIEVGFLDSRCEYDIERSMFPTIPSIARTLGNTRPKHAKLVAMIDFGSFDESLLFPTANHNSCLSGIRLIFTKEKVDEALKYAKKIKEAGYNLFLNLVSTSSYSNKELLALTKKINEISPIGVSIVDTYGLMFESDMEEYALLLDRNLDKHIILGYHSHNNMQMSNSNTIKFIKLNLQRDLIVDSSILGMGKNAGNACTELIVSYGNKMKFHEFDIIQVLECAYTNIMKFQNNANWGYRLDYLISAILRCSPNWTKTYMKNFALSIKDIYNILSALPEDKKYLPSFFSPNLAQKLLNEYISKAVDDTAFRAALAKELENRDILLVCPGTTIITHKKEIDKYISEYNPVIISINFIYPNINANYVFISNSIRYSQITWIYEDIGNTARIMITSNITPSPALPYDFMFNFKALYDEVGGNISAVLLLNLLLSFGINKITLAGFDGFDSTSKSYFDNGYILTFDNPSNEEIERELWNVKSKYDCSNIRFITPSKFEKTLRDRD